MEKEVIKTDKKVYVSVPALDLEIGGYAQVRHPSSKYNGCVGMVIGASYKKKNKRNKAIMYTLKFSDVDGYGFYGCHLIPVKPIDIDAR